MTIMRNKNANKCQMFTLDRIYEIWKKHDGMIEFPLAGHEGYPKEIHVNFGLFVEFLKHNRGIIII